MKSHIPTNPNDWIVKKLIKLQSILGVRYNKNGRHVSSHRHWIVEFIKEVDNGMVPERADLEKVNKLWKEYK